MNRLWIALAAMMTLAMPAWGQDSPHSDGIRPDPALTPGAIRTTDKADICSTKTGTVRNVSGSTKLQVYRRYGMKGPSDYFPGTSLGPPFEVDHFVPLTLGGANDITNLWPESSEGEWNFHVKDRLEVRMHSLVCKGQITVEEAQKAIASDWVSAYKKYVGDTPQESR